MGWRRHASRASASGRNDRRSRTPPQTGGVTTGGWSSTSMAARRREAGRPPVAARSVGGGRRFLRRGLAARVILHDLDALAHVELLALDEIAESIKPIAPGGDRHF